MPFFVFGVEMKYTDMLRILEECDEFPITSKKIAQIICDNTKISKVTRIGVELNTEILRGGYVRSEIVEDGGSFLSLYEPIDYSVEAKIYYARNQPEDWVRFVIIKELLHILDPIRLRVSSAAEIEKLVEHLRMPRELLCAVEGLGEREKAVLDYLSDYRALAVMVPKRMRIAFTEKLALGKIDEAGVARFLGFPEQYTAALFSEFWQRVVDAISSYSDSMSSPSLSEHPDHPADGGKPA